MKQPALLLLLLPVHAHTFTFPGIAKRSRLSVASSSVNGDGVAASAPSNKEAPELRDNLTLFEADVTKVIRVLRPWPYDPTVPAYFSSKVRAKDGNITCPARERD